MPRVSIREGDITESTAEVIVNAANTALQLGSGVAGAIRAKGGPSVQEECDRHGPVALGDVAVTGAGKLPARYIFHAAGMQLGGSVSEDSLRSCVRRVLETAERLGVRSLAMPAIGTGVGGLPLQRCAELMLGEVESYTPEDDCIEQVEFVLFGEPAYRIFEQVRDAARIRAQLARMKR